MAYAPFVLAGQALPCLTRHNDNLSSTVPSYSRVKHIPRATILSVAQTWLTRSGRRYLPLISRPPERGVHQQAHVPLRLPFAGQ